MGGNHNIQQSTAFEIKQQYSKKEAKVDELHGAKVAASQNARGNLKVYIGSLQNTNKNKKIKLHHASLDASKHEGDFTLYSNILLAAHCPNCYERDALGPLLAGAFSAEIWKSGNLVISRFSSGYLRTAIYPKELATVVFVLL